MVVDLSKFPEMNNFSSVIRYSLCMEEAMADFLNAYAEKLPSASEEMKSIASAHMKRYQLLEHTRQQKLNELILEPVSVDRNAYLPDLDVKDNSTILSKAIKAEENAEKLYTDLSVTAKELSREAAKVYKQLAQENQKLKSRLEALK